MALTLPQLDDRKFSDLVAELRSLIPRYDRAWTNYNPSDPGITLLELLAWLAEMVLYRLDRIEERTYLNFLDLLGVRHSAPRTVLTFELKVKKNGLDPDFSIPRDTLVIARDDNKNSEIAFATLEPVSLSQGRWDEERSRWIFKAPAINTIKVEKEFLGYATGKPHQELEFKQRPVFLDRADQTHIGNPRIVVDIDGVSEEWSYAGDLLDPEAALDPDPAKRPRLNRRFTVEPLSGLVRFGDGTYGAIPPAGARISCSYRRLGGAAANVKAGSLNILNDSIPSVDSKLVTVFNDFPVTGGVDEETLDDLFSKGLSLMAETSRAVSQDDFELLAKQAAPGRVARAKAVFGINLEDAAAPAAEAHVSVIVLPAAGYLWSDDPSPDSEAVRPRRTCRDMGTAMAGRKAKDLRRDIFDYLDQRRLVTSVVHVVAPSFIPMSLCITVQARQGVNVAGLSTVIQNKISTFLDPYGGWSDGGGWPFGRPVYRSELYQQIEGMEGVDHVESLLLNGAAAGSVVAVDEFGLLCLSELKVTVL